MKRFQRLKDFESGKLMIERGMEMGTIVCQHCNSTIGHIEVEKVTTLYGKCNHQECSKEDQKTTVAVK